MRLSEDVTVDGAARAIKLVRGTLKDIGADPDMGTFDADKIETGPKQTQDARDDTEVAYDIVSSLEDDHECGAPKEQAIERICEALEVDAETAKAELDELRGQGKVYEPAQGHLRTV